MKKLITLVLCAALAVPVTVGAMAANTDAPDIAPAPAEELKSGYTLRVDGKDTGADVCVIVPLREVAEKLGFTITWNGDNTIGIDDGTMHSVITVGKDLYQVTTSIEDMDGMSAPFSLGVAPYVADGTTYVPLKLFDALLGNQEGAAAKAVTVENGAISIRTASAGEDDPVQIPNPFIDCDTLAEAEKLAGFQLVVPDAVNQSASRLFRASEGSMLEVIYQDGETEIARIRKAPGAEEISGDHTSYAKVSTVSVDGVQVTMKGENDLVALAIWTNGGYTYSIAVESPISSADMTKLVSAIQ